MGNDTEQTDSEIRRDSTEDADTQTQGSKTAEDGEETTENMDEDGFVFNGTPDNVSSEEPSNKSSKHQHSTESTEQKEGKDVSDSSHDKSVSANQTGLDQYNSEPRQDSPAERNKNENSGEGNQQGTGGNSRDQKGSSQNIGVNSDRERHSNEDVDASADGQNNDEMDVLEKKLTGDESDLSVTEDTENVRREPQSKPSTQTHGEGGDIEQRTETGTEESDSIPKLSRFTHDGVVPEKVHSGSHVTPQIPESGGGRGVEKRQTGMYKTQMPGDPDETGSAPNTGSILEEGTDVDLYEVLDRVKNGSKTVAKRTYTQLNRLGELSSSIYVENGLEAWGAAVGTGGLLVLLLFVFVLQLILPLMPALIIGGSIGLALVAPVAWRGWRTGIEREKILRIEEARGETAAEAVPLVTDNKNVVRNKAALVVASVAQEAPGKVIRESSHNINEIFEFLVSGATKDGESAIACADALMYFSRDYPEYASNHEHVFYELLETAKDPVRGRITVAIANEARNRGEVTDEHVSEVTSVTESHDPDARKYAAIALGILGTDHAEAVLHELQTDSHPDVQEEARRGLKTIRGEE